MTGMTCSYSHPKRNPKDTIGPLLNEEAPNISNFRTSSQMYEGSHGGGEAWLAKFTIRKRQLFREFIL